eukprot:TRINITY_DN4785_c0_g1_i1.p1 TRINITY_DN4785_c0_g1~~TRINITY_DN4785_c0_g1_i1.p1  ORF type:complete len:115 (-),score=16.17 TRINITY_DN4785_c0_g1_i1:147-491(-)
MLKGLSGKTHFVYSGLVLLLTKPSSTEPVLYEFRERTKVTMTTLPEQTIRAYINTGSPMDKAGGYGIQDGMASSFVSRIEGCYFNVTGFPIFRFCDELRKLIENGTFNIFGSDT